MSTCTVSVVCYLKKKRPPEEPFFCWQQLRLRSTLRLPHISGSDVGGGGAEADVVAAGADGEAVDVDGEAAPGAEGQLAVSVLMGSCSRLVAV